MLAEFPSRPVPFVAIPLLEGADDLIHLLAARSSPSPVNAFPPGAAAGEKYTPEVARWAGL
jgi:hypothetical protein